MNNNARENKVKDGLTHKIYDRTTHDYIEKLVDETKSSTEKLSDILDQYKDKIEDVDFTSNFGNDIEILSEETANLYVDDETDMVSEYNSKFHTEDDTELVNNYNELFHDEKNTKDLFKEIQELDDEIPFGKDIEEMKNSVNDMLKENSNNDEELTKNIISPVSIETSDDDIFDMELEDNTEGKIEKKKKSFKTPKIKKEKKIENDDKKKYDIIDYILISIVIILVIVFIFLWI